MAQAVLVASVVAALLYLRLDSGAVTPEPATRLVSVPLCIVSAIFGASAWAARMRGQQRKAPWLAGFALGTGGYGILRLFVF